MDHLDDLAAAAQAAQSSPARAAARRSQHSSAPVVVALLFGSLVIGGAIVFVALRLGHPPQTTTTPPAGPVAPAQAPLDPEALAREIRAQKAAFQGFAQRLGDALARQHKISLDADGATSDPVVRYTCRYTLRRTGTVNGPNGRPTSFLVTFNGTIDGKGRDVSIADTCEINAAFVPTPEGLWKIDTATEKTLTHKTNTDLFGVPEKGGQPRDIAHIDWFNAAVKAAQKPEEAKD